MLFGDEKLAFDEGLPIHLQISDTKMDFRQIYLVALGQLGRLFKKRNNIRKGFRLLLGLSVRHHKDVRLLHEVILTYTSNGVNSDIPGSVFNVPNYQYAPVLQILALQDLKVQIRLGILVVFGSCNLDFKMYGFIPFSVQYD